MKVGDLRTFIVNIPDNIRLISQAEGETLDSAGADLVCAEMCATWREHGSLGMMPVPSNDPDMPEAVELARADVLLKTGIAMSEVEPTRLRAPSGWGFWVRCATLPQPGSPEFKAAHSFVSSATPFELTLAGLM